MSANVNATSLGANNPTLLRLRTAGNGPIVKVFANSNGILYVRSDASNTQIYSGTALGSGWHNIEVCGTVGVSGTWDLYRDGAKIVNAWAANTGTTPVGRVEIGNAQAVTATINFDDIVVDQTPGWPRRTGSIGSAPCRGNIGTGYLSRSSADRQRRTVRPERERERLSPRSTILDLFHR